MRTLRLTCLTIALVMVWLSAFAAQPAQAALPLLGQRIALDPGHGGPDPGANRGELLEEEIVLDLGLRLRDQLRASGAAVLLTRETDTDLADSYSGGEHSSRKRRDLLQRVKLINDWEPTLLISLHVNAIGSPRWRGAQVFYQEGNAAAEALAECIQNSLRDVLQNTDRRPKPGDFRILNDCQAAAVLVEVGFVSNPQEAALLASDAYRSQIAWAVYLGIINWLGQ